MKGLLLKDWYVLWKNCKVMLLMAALFIVASVIGGNAFFSCFASLFLAMLPITVMGLDERSKWDRYAITMPYSRKDMVLEKYVLALLGTVFASVLYAVGSLLYQIARGNFNGWGGYLTAICAMVSIGLLFSALNFPITFKVGVEKARLFFVLLMAVVGAIMGAFVSLAEIDSILPFVPFDMKWMILLVPLVVFVLFVFSFFLSVRFFQKREL